MNAALNGCGNVIPLRCALGNKYSTVELVTPSNNQGGTFCIENQTNLQENSNIAALVPLDGFKLENVSFMKIDVENAELSVLEGAEETIAKNRPLMLIEVQGNQQRPLILRENSDLMKQQSLKKIIDLGYSVKQIGTSCNYLALPIGPSTSS